MKECVWVLSRMRHKAAIMPNPVLVGQFEFREWTPDDHLRHSRFVALRDDKQASEVRREAKRDS